MIGWGIDWNRIKNYEHWQNRRPHADHIARWAVSNFVEAFIKLYNGSSRPPMQPNWSILFASRTAFTINACASSNIIVSPLRWWLFFDVFVDCWTVYGGTFVCWRSIKAPPSMHTKQNKYVINRHVLSLFTLKKPMPNDFLHRIASIQPPLLARLASSGESNLCLSKSNIDRRAIRIGVSQSMLDVYGHTQSLFPSKIGLINSKQLVNTTCAHTAITAKYLLNLMHAVRQKE